MTRPGLALPLVLLAGVLLASTPPEAGAVTRGELTGYVDRVAAVWAKRQSASGQFLDPRQALPAGGYGNVMIGYALLRSGVRRDDPRLVRAGLRGVGSSIDEPPEERGVFDVLAVAAAYNFARERLADDPSFAAVRPRWESYLRETGPPNIENRARDCIVSADCFHNHEMVGAAANLELLATGLPAPSLGDPAAVRRSAVEEVGVRAPRFAQPLLSDSGPFPLAYHALSSAMLARSIELLGRDAPPPSRAALRRTLAALAGFMAPDGAVAYFGRRQESLWSLAAAVTAAELAAAERGGTRAQAAAAHAVAHRAFARMRARYPLTPRGLTIVPRRRDRYAFSERGVDGNPMAFNGLALFLLELAIDAAPAREPRRSALPADRDGAFVDPDQNGFAAVRHGRIWYAVHRRRIPPDLRNDFGLVAAKRRTPRGDWVDVLQPRPYEVDAGETAGPVVERDGRRLLPGGPIALREGGAVEVGGAVPTRFEPASRGVRISLRARAGDTVTYTAYVPEREKRIPVASEPRVRPTLFEPGGFASCCETRLVGARFRVRVARSQVVSFTVGAARGVAGRRSQVAGNGGGTAWPWLIAVSVAAVLLAVVMRARRLRRAR